MTEAPTLPVDTSPVRDTAIALADVLVAGDEAAEGRRLLATIIGQMRGSETSSIVCARKP